VLRTLVVRHETELEEAIDSKGSDGEDDGNEEAALPQESTQRQNELLRRRLLCISSAFELLSGQGINFYFGIGLRLMSLSDRGSHHDRSW
jgi:hypothetical protein